MQNTMVITIKYADVIYAVRNKTHKLGKSSGAKDVRIESNLQADDTDQDTHIVTEAIKKGAGIIASELSKFVSGVTHGENGVMIYLCLPETWRTAGDNVLEDKVKNYLTDFTISEFLASARDNDESRIFMKSADAGLIDVKRIVYDKKSPLS